MTAGRGQKLGYPAQNFHDGPIRDGWMDGSSSLMAILSFSFSFFFLCFCDGGSDNKCVAQ